MEMIVHYEDVFANRPLHEKFELSDEDISRLANTNFMIDSIEELLKKYLPDLPKPKNQENTLEMHPSEMKDALIHFLKQSIFDKFDNFFLYTPESEYGKENIYSFGYSKSSSDDYMDKDLTISFVTSKKEEVPSFFQEYRILSKEEREEQERRNEYEAYMYDYWDEND